MVTLLPNNPVENLTWYSALVFANEMSKRAGLKPVYDFSNVTWKKYTKAQDGTLDIEKGRVKISAGSYYEAEGYRLPTEAEQEYFFGRDESKLNRYAWYKLNSEGITHPVAELEPIIINHFSFYDLMGNVNEWSWSFKGDFVYAGVNPQGPLKGNMRIYKGGDFLSSPEYLKVFSSSESFPRFRFKYLGFRLVRTMK